MPAISIVGTLAALVALVALVAASWRCRCGQLRGIVGWARCRQSVSPARRR